MNTENESEVTAARAYETLFVPALFAQWAAKVADSAHLSTGQGVLDVACGTGVLAREVRRRLGPQGYVAGVDPGAGMLAVAKAADDTIDWREGAAESLPFRDGTFDAVVSQFGLMFMDQPRALREMLRVLRPKGRLAVAVWDSVQNIPAYAAEIALLERMAGSRAADALRAPFVLGDPERLRAMFVNAGASSVHVATETGMADFPSMRVIVEADLRGWLPVMGVELAEEQIAAILEEAEVALAPFIAANGRAMFDVKAHIVTAHKP